MAFGPRPFEARYNGIGSVAQHFHIEVKSSSASFEVAQDGLHSFWSSVENVHFNRAIKGGPQAKHIVSCQRGYVAIDAEDGSLSPQEKSKCLACGLLSRRKGTFPNEVIKRLTPSVCDQSAVGQHPIFCTLLQSVPHQQRSVTWVSRVCSDFVHAAHSKVVEEHAQIKRVNAAIDRAG